MNLKIKKPKKNMDYVRIYAKALKENPRYFKQQRILINSQLKSSKALFRKIFGTGENFKFKARKYLKNIGKL